MIQCTTIAYFPLICLFTMGFTSINPCEKIMLLPFRNRTKSPNVPHIGGKRLKELGFCGLLFIILCVLCHRFSRDWRP